MQFNSLFMNCDLSYIPELMMLNSKLFIIIESSYPQNNNQRQENNDIEIVESDQCDCIFTILCIQIIIKTNK